MASVPLSPESDNPVWVYALIDPETSRVRYVGVSNRPKERLTEHCRDHTRTHRGAWIRKLCKRGLKPQMHILEQCTMATWSDRERFWIAHWREQGEPLTNANDGGFGMLNLLPEVREKIAIVIGPMSKERWSDPDFRAKVQATMRATAATPEERARKSADTKRRWQNNELREAQNKKTAERWNDPVWRAKMSIANSEARARAKALHPERYSSRYPGVSWYCQTSRWRANIEHHGKKRYLGSFKDEYDAHCAFEAAKQFISEHDALPPPVRKSTAERGAAMREAHANNPGIRKAASEGVKRAWADPIWRAKTLADRAAARARKKAAREV